MASKKYYVVEFRMPIEITEAATVEEAARRAKKIMERETGVSFSSWYTRVFEYGEGNENIGVVKEYFANPSGTTFRELTENIDKHEKLIKEGREHE